MSAPPVRGPLDLPALRVWLLDQWRPGRPFWKVGASMMGDAQDETVLNTAAERMLATLTAAERSDIYSRFELRSIGAAHLWYVTDEMMDVLDRAVGKIPDDVTVADLPAGIGDAGMVVFARPLHLTSREGEPIEVDGLVWSEARSIGYGPLRASGELAVGISSYQCVNLDDGLTGGQLQRMAVPITELLNAGTIDHDRPVPVAAGRTADDASFVASDAEGVRVVPKSAPHQPGLQLRLHGTIWCPLGRSDWPYSQRIDDAPTLYQDADGGGSAIEDRKVMAALWTLVNQTSIASYSVERPPRHVRRRVERAGLPASAADVRVVILRKLAHGHVTGEHVEGHKLDHRVIVGADTGGFWRNQPHGPKSAHRKLIWIDPFVRGPDDAPLRMPETVRVWKR